MSIYNSQTLKIAFILPSLANTGPGIVANDLCKEFIEMGHHCTVYYFNNIKELSFPCKSIKIKFTDKIPFNEFDVIHCHMFISDAYIKFHQKSIAKNVKLISTLHQPISYPKLKFSLNFWKASILAISWKRVLKVFNNIVVLNNDTYNELPSYLKGKASVIFNGRRLGTPVIESDEIANKIRSLKAKYNIIGCVSSIDYRKNIEQIVNSLPLLPNYALVVAGDGPALKGLVELSKALGISDRILFLGFQKNVSWIYQHFDIFAMCSRSEGFPLAFVEAASYGIPTILSNIQIFKSIILDDSVRFCELDNPISFAEQVEILEKNSRKYSKLILKYYQSYLTPNKMATNYLNLYTTN